MEKMTNKDLTKLISDHFGSDTAFMAAFNALGGELSYPVLCNQKAGRRNLSQAWRSAYRIFFDSLEKRKKIPFFLHIEDTESGTDAFVLNGKKAAAHSILIMADVYLENYRGRKLEEDQKTVAEIRGLYEAEDHEGALRKARELSDGFWGEDTHLIKEVELEAV